MVARCLSWTRSIWDELLVPEIGRQQAAGTQVAFRADAAFAKPEIYDALEKRSVPPFESASDTCTVS